MLPASPTWLPRSPHGSGEDNTTKLCNLEELIGRIQSCALFARTKQLWMRCEVGVCRRSPSASCSEHHTTAGYLLRVLVVCLFKNIWMASHCSNKLACIRSYSSSHAGQSSSGARHPPRRGWQTRPTWPSHEQSQDILLSTNIARTLPTCLLRKRPRTIYHVPSRSMMLHPCSHSPRADSIGQPSESSPRDAPAK